MKLCIYWNMNVLGKDSDTIRQYNELQPDTAYSATV
jgi:hypothetical protein